jgi:hypothetical protein
MVHLAHLKFAGPVDYRREAPAVECSVYCQRALPQALPPLQSCSVACVGYCPSEAPAVECSVLLFSTVSASRRPRAACGTWRLPQRHWSAGCRPRPDWPRAVITFKKGKKILFMNYNIKKHEWERPRFPRGEKLAEARNNPTPDLRSAIQVL